MGSQARRSGHARRYQVCRPGGGSSARGQGGADGALGFGQPDHRSGSRAIRRERDRRPRANGSGATGTIAVRSAPGRRPSWTIEEHEIRTHQPGQRIERIAGVSLPAWNIESKTNLLADPERFASAPAHETMRYLIGPSPDDRPEAVQAAVASFTRYGFEAAAVTAFGIATSAQRPPGQRGIEHTAVLRFDHPYAALAIAGRAVLQQPQGTTPNPQAPWHGLPLFSAWIHEPEAPGDRPPAAPA